MGLTNDSEIQTDGLHGNMGAEMLMLEMTALFNRMELKFQKQIMSLRQELNSYKKIDDKAALIEKVTGEKLFVKDIAKLLNTNVQAVGTKYIHTGKLVMYGDGRKHTFWPEFLDFYEKRYKYYSPAQYDKLHKQYEEEMRRKG